MFGMQAPPTPSPVCRCRAAALGVAALTLALTACSSKPAARLADPTPVPTSIPPSAPGVRASENGMEMMWWGVNTGARPLAELLAPYLDEPAGIDPRTRTLWQTNGLRLVTVPTDRLDTIQQLLRQTGGVQRQWLGQVSTWTDVIHGSPWHDLQPVEMDNGRLYLGPGRLRALLRCWTIPLPAAADANAQAPVLAAMRAELLLQHLEPPRVDPSSLYERPRDVTDPLQQGLVFSRLAASITLPPDRALLVIPESPSIDWRALAQIPQEQLDNPALAVTRSPVEPPAGETDPEVGVGQILRGRAALRERDASSPATPPDAPGPTDPSAAFARTLGELLLSPNLRPLGSDLADRPSVRSVLVLVPRIPTEFRLEPPTPAP